MADTPAPPPPDEPSPPAVPAPDEPAAPSARVAASGADLVLLISSALFLVATFLPWYRLELGSGSARVAFNDSGWGSGSLGTLAAVFGAAVLAVAISIVVGSKVLSGHSATLLALVLSSGALVFTILRLAFRPKGSAEVERIGAGLIEITRGVGVWLAFFAAIVMAAAAYQKYRRTAV